MKGGRRNDLNFAEESARLIELLVLSVKTTKAVSVKLVATYQEENHNPG